MTFLKCPVCPSESEKRYDTSQLQDHIGAEHLDGFYSFQCTHCPKSFNSAYRGYAHMKLKCKMKPNTEISHYMEPLLLQDGQKLKEMNRLLNEAVRNYGEELLATNGANHEFGIAPEAVNEQKKQKQKLSPEKSQPKSLPPLPPKVKNQPHEQVTKLQDVADDTAFQMGMPLPSSPFPPSMMKKEHVEKSRDVVGDDTVSEISKFTPRPSHHENGAHDQLKNSRDTSKDDVASQMGNIIVSGSSPKASTIVDLEPRRQDIVLPPTIDGELYDDDISHATGGCRSATTLESEVFYPDPNTPYNGAVLASPGKQAKYNVADTLYLIDRNFRHSLSCSRNPVLGCCPTTCDWLNEVARLITQEDGFYKDAVNYYKREARKIQIALRCGRLED